MCTHNSACLNQPNCIVCGETDPSELEFHSIGGYRILLCRKCFGRLCARASPRFIWDPPDELEVIAHAVLGQADLLAMLAQAHSKFGHMLLDRVRREAPDEGDLPSVDEDVTPQPRTTENPK